MQSIQPTTPRLFNLLCNVLTYKDVSVCKLSHRRRCLCATCHIISYVLSQTPWFHAHVSTTRRVHVRVRALKNGCVHTFWLTKTCLCVTFHIRNHVDAKDCDACSLWKDVPLRNFLTYMGVSACTFSDKRMCLYTTCHIISYVCARPTCFHAVSRLPDVFMCVFAH